MAHRFEPILSDEQFASYLDGMLSTEENNMVETIVDSSPDMMEIQNAMDSVDSSLILGSDTEVPLECMADDFSLPAVDVDIRLDDDSPDTSSFDDDTFLGEPDDAYDENDSFSVESDDDITGVDFDDVTF